MAPPQKSGRPDRRRTRLTLRPVPEGLETRTVPANLGISSIAPLGLLNPTGGTGSPTGYTPQQIRAAYGFNQISFGSVAGNGAGQTIAIVDAYDDPGLVSSTSASFSTSDLAEFDRQFALPDPPSFTKLNEAGNASPLPGTDPAGAGNPSGNWETEEAMDVEWAHALAPSASIVLVEANSSNSGDLYAALNIADHLPGVSVVSMSWGGAEFTGENYWDQNFQTPAGHQGETFVAASGDAGAPGIYPAYSPDVLAVGGTDLQLNAAGSIESETAWSNSGGGVSADETEPSYQKAVQNTGDRTIPDVSFDASSATGVAVYDSYDNTGSGPWFTMWGTSLGAPSWAALVAVADQGRVAAGGTTLDGGTQTLPALYSLPSADFHDINSGGNGTYNAGPGYDEVTGLGTPVANLLAPDLAYYGMADHLAITSEPASSVTAGQAIGLTVAVEGPGGTIDTSAGGTLTISLSNQPGGASLGGTLTATIVDGLATFSGLTIDQAGSGDTLSAVGGGYSPVTSSAFTVTPAAASRLAIATEPPSSLSAGSGFGLTVDVEDAFGNLIAANPGTVTLSLAGGPAGAGLGGTLTVAASGGVASFSGLSIDQAGAGYTIVASDGGLSTATSNAFSVTPSAPAQLVIEAGPPSSVAAGSGFGLTVAVVDAYGNVDSNDSGDVTVAIEATGGASNAGLLGTTSVPASGGLASFNGLSIDQAGAGYVVRATASGLSSASTGPFTITPAAPAQLVIEAGPPPSVTAGVGFGLTVAVQDAYGNVEEGYGGAVTVGLAGGPAGGVLAGTTTIPATDGVATFIGLNLTLAGSGYVIEASGAGLADARSSPIAVTPAAPAQLDVIEPPPSTLSAGLPFSLGVSVEDAFGNIVSIANDPVSLSLSGGPSGASLGGTMTATTADGVATFVGLTIDQTGSPYRIQASSPGLTGASTPDLSVSPAIPAQLVITLQPPSSVAAGSGFGIGVSVEDAYGNTVTGYSGLVSLSLNRGTAGASLLGTASEAAEQGVATFTGLTIQKAGDESIEVVAQGLGHLSTTNFQVVPAAPSQLVIVDPPPGRLVAGESFGFTAAVEDPYGNVADDFQGVVTASLADDPAGGSLDGPVSAIVANGIATFSGLALEKAGEGYAVAASSGGLTSAASAPITVAAGPPSRLLLTSQPPGNVQARRPFAIGVEAVDAYGNPTTAFDGQVLAALSAGPVRATLHGTLSVRATGGQALINDAVVNQAGKPYVVTITSSGLAPASTPIFEATRPSARRFAAALRHDSRSPRSGPGALLVHSPGPIRRELTTKGTVRRHRTHPA